MNNFRYTFEFYNSRGGYLGKVRATTRDTAIRLGRRLWPTFTNCKIDYQEELEYAYDMPQLRTPEEAMRVFAR